MSTRGCLPSRLERRVNVLAGTRPTFRVDTSAISITPVEPSVHVTIRRGLVASKAEYARRTS